MHSCWAAAVSYAVPEGMQINGFRMFLRTIPYNLYALTTLLMLVLLVTLKMDYGPMAKHEANAKKGDLFTSGERAYAQLSFRDDTLVARNLDRFIVRFFSPMITVGGGVILDMKKRRLRRNDPDIIARLDRLNGAPEERVYQMVADAGTGLIREEELGSVSGLSAGEVRAALQTLQRTGRIVQIQGGYAAKETLDAVWGRIEALLTRHHESQSLMEGIHLGELRSRIFAASPKTADAILAYYQQQGLLRIRKSSAALAGFETSFSDAQAQMRRELEDYYLRCGAEAPTNAETAAHFRDRQKLCRQVTAKLVQDGVLVALNPDVTVHSRFCRQALDTFVCMCADSETVALGEFRTKFGVSRKYAQQYLDYFDSQKISRLVGDRRVLLKSDK